MAAALSAPIGSGAGTLMRSGRMWAPARRCDAPGGSGERPVLSVPVQDRPPVLDGDEERVMADERRLNIGGTKSRVDVEALLDSDGWGALLQCISLGALVGLGTTADGGALGVTITVDGAWDREYFRDADELRDWMAEALPVVRDALEASAASSGRGSRSRSPKRGL